MFQKVICLVLAVVFLGGCSKSTPAGKDQSKSGSQNSNSETKDDTSEQTKPTPTDLAAKNGGSAAKDITPDRPDPTMDSESGFVFPDTDDPKSVPVWGHKNGIRIGLAPAPGPNGIIRIYAPYLGQEYPQAINRISIEPTVVGQQGRDPSELLPSSVRPNQKGLVFWASDTLKSTGQPAQKLAAGIVDEKLGTLRMFIHTERFKNGAVPIIECVFDRKQPYEVKLITHAAPESKPMTSCTLSATMGHYALLNQVRLGGQQFNSAQNLFGHRRLNKFDYFDWAMWRSSQLSNTSDGTYLIEFFSDAKFDNLNYRAETPTYWLYKGKKTIQYWRAESGSNPMAAANGRNKYWTSDAPLPVSISFVNTELRMAFKAGRAIWFGVRPDDSNETSSLLGSPDLTQTQKLEFIDAGLKTTGKTRAELETLLKDAKNGKAKAQNELGELLANGVALTKDNIAAAAWFQKAADQGFAEAQKNLGKHYVYGEGVLRDPLQGVEWLKKAANQNLTSAQIVLGDIYNSGLYIPNVPRDKKETQRWYEMAANQGDATAQLKLGFTEYSLGIVEEGENDKAISWFRKSALQGNTKAQIALGGHYDRKFDSLEDEVDAFVWYSVAAKSGDESAKRETRLQKESLNPDQLAKAKKKIEIINAIIKGTKEPKALAAFESSAEVIRRPPSLSELNEMTSGLTTLTVKQAKEFVKYAQAGDYLSGLNLSSVSSLEDKVATELAKLEQPIQLQGLKELPDSPGFLALLKQQGRQNIQGLHFPAVTKLSEGVAKVLAENARVVYFENLESLQGSPSHLKLLKKSLRYTRTSTDKLKHLSPEAAELLVESVTTISLPKLEEMSVPLAKVLGKSKGFLELYEKDYSREVLTELVKHRGYLQLHGLTNLEDWQAELLGSHRRSLILPKITQISAVQASHLAKYEGMIEMNGITDLLPESIEPFSQGKVALSLNGIKELNVEQAKSFGKLKTPLILNGVTEITETVAKELGRQSAALSLAGLRQLSPATAKHLIQSGQPRLLDGITEISDEVSEILGQSKSDLKLGGVIQLSEIAATNLANSKSRLGLSSLKQLGGSEGHLKLARKIADTNFLFQPGIEKLDKEVARIFSESKASEISLRGLKTISDEAAANLSKFKGSLGLSGLTTLSETAAESLSKHKGNLDLSGIKQMTRKAMQIIRRHPNVEIEEFGMFGIGIQDLDVVRAQQMRAKIFETKKLTDEQAEVMSKSIDPLYLSPLASITDKQAEILSKHKGRELVLTGLKDLSDAAAAHLGKHAGSVRLPPKLQPKIYAKRKITKELAEKAVKRSVRLDQYGLIDADAAKVLAETKGGGGGIQFNLNLSGIHTLSDEAAAELARIPGNINLGNVRTLSVEAAKSFAKYPGQRLNLRGLTEMSDEAARQLCNSKRLITMPEKFWTITERVAEKYLQNPNAQQSFPVIYTTRLDDDAAEVLKAFPKSLNLSRVVQLSDEALKSLSEHKGGVGLGLKTLTDSQASIFNKHFTDKVYLHSLEVLSDEHAKLLAGSKGEIYSKKFQAKIDSFKK